MFRITNSITENKIVILWFTFVFFFYFVSFPICHSYTNLHHFVSKISQGLLNLEFWNLVQSLGMTSCIVYLRINNLWLIIPFIYPFFSLSEKFFHHNSSVCIRVRDFKFYMHVQNGLLYYWKQDNDSVVYFCLLFFTLFLLPSVTPIQICTFLSGIGSIRGI